MAALPPGGTPGGIVHDFQTEGYYIVSGGGTMFTDGYIVNGKHNNQITLREDPTGRPAEGMAYEREESRREAWRRDYRSAREWSTDGSTSPITWTI